MNYVTLDTFETRRLMERYPEITGEMIAQGETIVEDDDTYHLNISPEGEVTAAKECES